MVFHSSLYTLLYILTITKLVLSNEGLKAKTRWLPHLVHTEAGIIDIPSEHEKQTSEDNHSRLKRRQMLESNKLSDFDKQAILDAHNMYRAMTARGDTSGQPSATNMQEIFWDPALAKVAEGYSRNCLFEHNAARLTQFKEYINVSSFTQSSSMSVGENLFLTTRTASLDSLLKGLEAFYAEYQYFTFDNIACTTGQQCGHYRQLVQATTRYVGCGYTYCPSAYYSAADRYYSNAILLACNYSPASNAQPYVKGTPCTGCLQDRVCVNKTICGGCPNPNYWYCLDSSSTCSSVTSRCPTSPKCDFDSTNTLCTLCRTTCGTCTNEGINGTVQALSCNNGISQYSAAVSQTPSPTRKPTKPPTKPPTQLPTNGINEDYCCHAIAPDRYEERCNLLTSIDTCNDSVYSRKCYWSSSSKCPTLTQTSSSDDYYCTSAGTRKKASCELIPRKADCEYSGCSWSLIKETS